MKRSVQASLLSVILVCGVAFAAAVPDGTIPQLEAALHRFPDNHQLQFNLGLALLRAGRFAAALDPLRKSFADPALAGQAHFLLAVDYFETKQYASAVTELKNPLTTGPRERVLYMLEESYRRTGRVTEAEAAFHELFTDYPDSAWTHYLMGAAYEDQREPEKAREEYLLAAQKDPTLPDIDFSLGYIYFRDSNLPQAEHWFAREAVKGCHSLANYYLGEIARANNQPQKAEAFYQTALHCDPANVDAHIHLGTLFESEKRYSSALAQFREASRLQPSLAPPHYHLATVYRELGRKAEADAEFAKVKQLHTNADRNLRVTNPKP